MIRGLQRRCGLARAALLAAALVPALAATAQRVEVEEFVLDNGMTFLLSPRDDQPNSVAAGWVAKVGSVNERPGITGISHFFEHMMFKGTTTIGTRDAERERELMAAMTAVRERINDLVWTEQYERYFRGEIDDPWNPANDTEELTALREELRELQAEHQGLVVKNEFDRVYTEAGATGMNAFTSYDLTFYIINLPANKLELWAWMESDRLADSVFREFYAERDVVHEERRLRTESTPTGEFDEQFDAMFWQSSGYAWPVIGWPSDLNSYTREEAERYFDVYYRPNNLVGVIVGDFDAEAIKPMLRRYFGRLEPGPVPPPVVTLEVPQKAQTRMIAEVPAQSQLTIRYHTVPFAHRDSYPLEVLASLLNGRTGILYETLVEGKSLAASARAAQDQRKYAGAFEFNATVKGDATPETIEEAWYEIVEDLKTNPVSERELQKVKNQLRADAFRALQDNFFLMIQLGYLEALGGWEYINESNEKLQAVTAEDVRRVARRYLEPANSAVAIYRRVEAGTGPDAAEHPSLAALPPELKSQAKVMLEDIEAETSVSKLRGLASRFSTQRELAPEVSRPFVDYLVERIHARIETLRREAEANAADEGDEGDEQDEGEGRSAAQTEEGDEA